MSLEDLDPELKRLLSSEREASLPGADAARRRIAQEIFVGGAPAAAAAAVWSTKALVGVAVGCTLMGALAGSVITTLRQEEPPAVAPTSQVAPDAATEVTSEEIEAAHIEPDAQAREEVPLAMQAVQRETAREDPHPPSRLARERGLIDQARVALRGGRPHDALVALMGHERQFARGALAEERERLAIEALVAMDRGALARTRAVNFLRDFPRSAHRTWVESTLGEF